jgi:hypothetical protein
MPTSRQDMIIILTIIVIIINNSVEMYESKSEWVYICRSLLIEIEAHALLLY